MMYDELIKNLRNCSEINSLSRYKRDLMEQAADAIEDLDNRLNLYRQGKISHWIPVAERLPENGQKVLAFKTLDTKPPVPWYLILSYSTNLESVSEYEFQNETHGGFYEYDDGYYERTGITHWMQLPKPPEDK